MSAELIQTNRRWLEQALDVLASLDDATYANSPAGLAPHRAGGHLRHILEFYECFFAGLRRGWIDYDSRRRDARVETSVEAAAARIQTLLEQLAELDPAQSGRRMWVKTEASVGGAGVLTNMLTSSIGRELQVLSSHTVHHFALMAVTLQAWGVTPPKDFGVAPSTLRYQQKAA